MRGDIFLLICALALAKGQRVVLNRIGCPIDHDSDLLLPHPKCSQYYQCVRGTLVTRDCPQNLLYNAETQQCDWPENVICLVHEDKEAEESSTVNSDPSQAPAICATEGSEGVLVAHENCNKFYKCDNGKPVTLSCFGNLHYNPITEYCDWPENVDCGDRIVSEGSGDSGNSDNTDPNDASAICSQEGSEDILVAHQNCNQYYKCSEGKPVAFKCPGDLFYDAEKEYCDCKDHVECGNRNVPDSVDDNNSGSDNGDNDNESDDNDGDSGNNGENDDPSLAPIICANDGSDGVLIAHEKCNKFYICAEGTPVALKCPGSLLYNPSTEQCDWDEKVECGNRVIPDESDSDAGNDNGGSDNGGGDNGGSDNDGSDNGSGDDNGNGGSDASNGGNDDPSQAPTICANDGSDGVLIAHEKCNKFYICAEGTPVALKCPGSLLYNPSTEQCDWAENVECGNRVIPDESDSDAGNDNGGSDNGGGDNGGSDNDGSDNGSGDDNGNGGSDAGNGGNDDPSQAPTICANDGSDGVLIAHEKCNKFYICAEGTPVALKCPGSLLYNPSTEQCDWAENVKCGNRVIPDESDSDDGNDNGGSDNGGGDNGGSDNDGSDNGSGDDNGNGGSDAGNGGNDDPSQAPTICANDGSDGVLIAHEKCNKFYICAEGTPVALKCPGSLLYNPSTEQCDWAENVECGNRVIPDESDSDAGNDNGGSDNGGGDNGGSDNDGSDNGSGDDNGNGGSDASNGGNDDPSQAPTICANDGSDGVLIAHEKCNKFYICAEGTPVALKCPGSLLYNPSTEQCDWAENVKCGNRVIPDESDSDAGNDNGGSDNGGGDNGGSDNDGSDNGSGDDNGNGGSDAGNGGNDDPSQAPTICANDGSDGVLIAHEKCNKFYICAEGTPVALKCPGSLLYNPSTEQCDWAENVECGNRVIPDESDSDAGNDNGGSDNGGGDNGGSDNDGSDNGSGDDNGNGGSDAGNGGNDDPSQAPTICANDGSDGVLIAHEKCNKFYICAEGTPVALKCPGSLLYNPSTEQCDWAENVECGNRVIPDESDSDAGNDNGGSDNGGGDNGGSDNDGSDNGSGDDNGNGGSDASNGGNDDPSQAPTICANDGSDGVLIAHEKCNKFYICAEGTPVALKCPGSLLYNPSTEQCDWAENVKCGNRVIPDESDSDDGNDNGGSDNGGGDNGGSDNDGSDNGSGDDNGNGGSDAGNGGNDDPSQAPTICANDGSDGVLIAHEKCNKFYICAEGTPVALKCPGSLLYNPSTEQCDWAENVECGNRVIPDESDSDAGNDNGGSDNGGGDNGGSDNDGSDNGSGDDNGNGGSDASNGGNDDPSQAPTICANDGSDGVLIAHEKCNKFYICAEGTPVALKCPGSLLYNPSTEQCDWAENVECGNRVIPDESDSDAGNDNGGSDNGGGDNGGSDNDGSDNGSGDDNGNGGSDASNGGNDDPSQAPTICANDGSDGVLIAHEKCNKFYICAEGTPVALKCPGSLLYNPSTEQCDWAENVKCGNRVIPDESDSDAGNDNGGSDNGGGDNGGSDNDGSDNGSGDDNGNGGSDAGNGGNDDPSQAPTICANDGSDGVLIAHEKCNKFYICAEGTPVALKCPGSLLYNPSTEQCDWAENVECGNRVIPDESDSDAGNDNGGSDNGGGDNGGSDNDGSDNGSGDDNGNGGSDAGNGGNDDPSQAPTICANDGSDGVLIAHEKCNKFYICAEGTPVALKCPGSLLYNPSTEQCDWDEKVECGNRVIPDESDSDAGNDNGGSDNGGGDNGGSDNDGSDNGSGDDNGNGGSDASNGGNDDPSQAPTICANDGSDGVLIAHEKCNKFYICAEGTPVALKCPGSLLYNPSTEQCDWAENVECGNRVIPDESDSDAGNDNGGSDNGGGDNGGSDNDGSDNGSGDDNGNGGSDAGNGGNDDPSQAPTICANDGSDGVLIAHEKCNKFYICAEGTPVALKCPGSLLYNPSTELCDWAENVECGNRVIPDESDSDDGNDNGGSDNGGGDNGGSDNDGSDNGSGDDNCNGGSDAGNGGNDDPSQAPTICANDGSDGVLIAHEKCNKFYICAEGTPVALKCPGSLLYNPSTEQCDWAENVECGNRVIPDESDSDAGNDNGGSDNGGGDNGGSDHDGSDNGSGDDNGNGGSDAGNGGNDDPSQAPTICANDGSDGVLIAHEKCNKFYICAEGKPVALKCPGSLLYNPSTEQCDWAENVECGNRVIPDESDSDAGNDNGGSDNGGGDNGGSDNDGSDNGSGDDNGNGGSDAGNGGNDDPSQAPTICANDGSDGVLIAHEKCNKFYICAEGKPVALKCPGSLLYNPSTEQCDWPENVKCGNRVIPDESDSDAGNDNGGSDNGGADNGGSDNGGGDNGSGGSAGNDDPSQAPAICAAEGSEGVFVAHENCNQFYVCVEGKPVVLSCPGNLLYNPSIEQCDWPENVKCGNRVIPDESDSDAGNDNGGSDSGGADNGGSDNGGGDNGIGGSAGNDDPSQAPAICAAEGSEGVFVAHENCNQFYVCVEGKPVVLSCPGNLLYNPSIEQCDWPENVKCGNRVIPDESDSDAGNDNGGSDNGGADNGGSDNGGGDNGSGCSAGNDDPSQAPAICAAEGSEGVFVAHENCNQFYVCVEGKPVVLSCPGNLLYNPSLEQCDWPENVKCGNRVIPDESDSDAGNDNGGSDSGGADNGDSDNGGGDNGSGGSAGNDDPSQAPAICAAEGSEGVFVAHENCNQFYVCVEGKPVVLSCPGNLLYNPSLEQCDWPENVKCGNRVIPDESDSDAGNDNGGSDSGGADNGGSDNGGGDNGSGGSAGNDDPSQAPAICAAEGSEGVFVAHENCNQFYVCVEGKPVVLSCPGNLLYNPSIEQCDWPENVKCGNRVIPDESDSDAGNDNGGSDSGGADNGGSDNGGGDNGSGGSAGNDDPSQAPAICAAEGSEGVFVAHENCNQFYVCVEGKPVVLSCPGNLLYNPSIEQCDWPENVKYGNRVIPDESDSDAGNDNGGSDNGGADNGGSDNGGGDNGSGGSAGNDDPSQAPAICAAEGSEGVFVAHENCNQFYVCVEGKPVVLSCPGNLLYNPSLEQCDWPENVKCGNRVIPDESDSDAGNDNGGSDSGGADNGGSDNGGGDNGSGGSAGNDDPSQAPAICAAEGSEGVFVAHENCNQFYVCVEGKPVVLSCPGNLLYNPSIEQCDWPENVKCGNKVIPDESDSDAGNDNGGSDNGGADNGGSDNGGGDNGSGGSAGNDDPSQAPTICAAEGSEGVFVAHENCNQFYVCVEGKPVVLSCPGNLLYNPSIEQCDWPENVKCGNRVIPDESDSDAGNDNGGSDNGCADNGGSDNGGGDNGSVGSAGNDDPSQAPAICAAEGSEGVFVAHENCNQFYVCIEGKPVVLSCPGILLYNPSIEQCDWSENVKCGNRVIPDESDSDADNDQGDIDDGTSDSGDNDSSDSDSGNNDIAEENAIRICSAEDSEGIYIPHQNCNQFYVCLGQRPAVLTCASILLYDPANNQCDWPQNVDCGNRIIPSADFVSMNKHIEGRYAYRV